MPRRIKYNNLLPWFMEDHGQLPAGYVRACEKFFKAGREDAEMYERQASSTKPQAASLTGQSSGDTSRIIKEKL